MRVFYLLILLSLSFSAYGHGGTKEKEESKIQVGAAASLSWYSNGTVGNNEFWRIPGLLMGGEALPTEEGFALDDAILWGRYRLNDSVNVYGKLGVHGGGESHHNGVNLENIYVKYKTQNNRPFTASAGVMEADFSPSATHHASLNTFAEASLLTDAFMGRGGHDTGIRLNWKPAKSLILGAEVWNGDVFPATDGGSGGAQDVYLKFNTAVSDWSLNSGVWAMKADAFQRGDERYSAGHTHGTDFAPLPADIRFSGDTEMSGAWLAVTSPDYRGAKVGFQYEAIKSEASGELFDTTRKAGYSNNNLGYSLTTNLNYSDYQLSYRYENLSLENQLDGAAAQFLAEDANLVTNRNPDRQTLQLKWQAHKKVALRAAYTQDNTLPDETDRYSLGLVWNDIFYEK